MVSPWFAILADSRIDQIQDEEQFEDVRGTQEKEYVAAFEGVCSTYTSVYKTTERDRTAVSLLLLETIYSTTILVGDADISNTKQRAR
jgi:hypothetical protein